MTAVDGAPSTGERPATALDDGAARVDRALEAVRALPGAGREAALELQAAIEAFHREPLVRIVRALRADERGRELLYDLVDDDAVRALFTLHGIVRPDPVTAAQRALDTVRPYLRSHGGDVELLGVADGVASVRLHGACNGCSMSAVTLREGVEDALLRAVDSIRSVEVVADEPTAAFIPLGVVGTRRAAAVEQGWVEVGAAADVPLGGMRRVDVDGDSFVLTNVGGALGAFRNECVHQGRSLDGGVIDDGVLVCPWHGFRFDATSGECLSAPGAQLPRIPLRVDAGQVVIRAR